MRHIYLHVPFCRRRCSYCDFAIAVRRTVPAERYVRAIKTEHDFRRQSGEWDRAPLETLYLGGGTPSLLAAPWIAELVQHFLQTERASRTGELEITVEANPEDVTEEAARIWASCGVNRVSLGVQSFDPKVLAWMRRTHGPDAPARAVERLREAAIKSISLDLIFALPESLGRDFRRDLELALALEPDHLSLYGLSVEPRTPLARWVSRGAIAPPDDERYAQEFLLAHEILSNVGFEHYEISNYARPGFRARHNSAYWRADPYAGLGPAAHRFGTSASVPSREGPSFPGLATNWVRAWNVDQWAAYERRVADGQDPTAQREIVSPQKRALETVYLGLRTSEGVSLSDPLAASALRPGPLMERAVAEGWLKVSAGRLVPTPEGWLRLDSLVVSLTTSTGSG